MVKPFTNNSRNSATAQQRNSATAQQRNSATAQQRNSATAHLAHNSTPKIFPSSAKEKQSSFLCTNTKVLVNRAGRAKQEPATLPTKFQSFRHKTFPRSFRGLFAILAAAFLFYACTPPDSSSSGAPTYTTTVSGKITTPAGNAVMQYNTATGRYEPSSKDAKVRASTAPATKVPVKADGSYTLKVVGHPGSFKIHVSYPAGRDYKAPANPQEVKTSAATLKAPDIALKYGYTTKLSGQVADNTSGSTFINRNNLPVIIEVEGREWERTLTGTIGSIAGSYSIEFRHPGTFKAKASFGGRNGMDDPVRHTGQPEPPT